MKLVEDIANSRYDEYKNISANNVVIQILYRRTKGDESSRCSLHGVLAVLFNGRRREFNGFSKIRR